MASKKLSELSIVEHLDPDDLLYATVGGESKSIKFSDLEFIFNAFSESYTDSEINNSDTRSYQYTRSYTEEAILAALPVGVMQLFAGSSAPNGYLICDGSAISRTSYLQLFNVIGETYGSGDGSSTFNLPNPDVNANLKYIIKVS